MSDRMPPEATVIGNFLQRAGERPSQALWFTRSGRSWQRTTREEARIHVVDLAAGLAASGIAKGDRVCLMGSNVPDWLIADYALQHIGAVVVPLYVNSPVHQIEEVLDRTGARTILVYGDEALGRIREAAIEGFVRIIALHAADGPSERIIGREEILRRGEQWAHQNPGGLDRLLSEVGPDDLATVIFTSGTAGDPKGVRLTHRNLVWAASAGVEAIGARSKEKALCYLPLAHAFERVVATVIPIVSSTRSWTCWFVPDMTDLPSALRSVRPTVFIAVPVVWSRMRERILSELSDRASPKTEFARRIVTKADPHSRDTRPWWRRSLLAPLSVKLIGRRVLKKLGLGRCWFAVSGAAPLPAETQTFFQTLGLPLQQGWGLTETAALATVQRPGDLATGVVGQAIEGVEIAIGPGDEILVRGPNVFAGYEGESSAPVDNDGYFHTGDIGHIDDAGRLTIVDRNSDLLITAGGANVSPRPIETMLIQDPLISGAVVLGEGRPYLIALIAIDSAHAARLAEGQSTRQLWENEAVRAKIERTLASVNRSQPESAQVRRFSVLPFGFPDEAMTPTLKLKRRVVESTFADVIEELYE